MSNKRKIKNKTNRKHNGRVTSKTRPPKVGPDDKHTVIEIHSLPDGYEPLTADYVRILEGDVEDLVEGRIEGLGGLVYGSDSRNEVCPALVNISFSLEDVTYWGETPTADEVASSVARKLRRLGMFADLSNPTEVFLMNEMDALFWDAFVTKTTEDAQHHNRSVRAAWKGQ